MNGGKDQMVQEEKGAIAKALKILDVLENTDAVVLSGAMKLFINDALTNLQAFVDEAKNYEKDYGVSQYNFREFVEIVTEALRGIEG